MQVPPGSNSILYAAGTPAYFSGGKIVAERMDSGKRVIVLQNAMFPRYLNGGVLTFIREGTLFGIAFDLDRLQSRGNPVPLISDIQFAPDSGGISCLLGCRRPGLPDSRFH